MTIIFKDEFELGSLVPPWTTQNDPGTNTLAISQDLIHHGNNCLKATNLNLNTNCCMEKTVGPFAELYFREYWATPAFPTVNNLFSFMSMVSTSGTIAACYLWLTGASQRICVRNQVTTTNYNTTVFPAGFVANKYYSTELYVLVSDTVGIIRVWLDGNLMYNVTGIDTNNGANISTIRAGTDSTRNSENHVFDIDCCVASDRYIGTEFINFTRHRSRNGMRNTQMRRNDHNPEYPNYPPLPR